MISDPAFERVRRIAVWCFAAVALLFVLACVWVGVRGALAAQHLAAAQSGLTGLTADLAAGPQDDAGVDELREEFAAAHALTSDAVWIAMSGLPWLGPQLHAVGAVAAAADEVGQGALAPLSAASASLDPASLAPRGGRVDLDALVALQAPTRQAAASVNAARDRLDQVDVRQLISPLAARVGEVKEQVGSAASVIDGLARATQLVPAILGADGPRTYLLLFQNNAELRSLGGIPGSIAQISTDGGAFAITAQAAARDFPEYTTPILMLSDDVRSVTGDKPAEWMQDVTQATDFPTAARLAAAMWEREQGVTVDGVMAVDPVALSYLLAATGPISLPSGDELTAENATSLLLNEVYFRYPDPATQDVFFATAASTVMKTLSDGVADPTRLVTALSRAAAERRLLIWNARDDEQEIVTGTTLAGGLPESDEDTARFGVYLNDGTGSKMDYYLDESVGVEWDVCSFDATATLTLELVDTAPPPDQLPEYITGGGSFGVPAGVMRVLAYIYLPQGWSLVSSDAPETSLVSGGVHDGRRVVIIETDLLSGDAVRLAVTAAGPEVTAVEAQVTPTVNTNDTQEVERSC